MNVRSRAAGLIAIAVLASCASQRELVATDPEAPAHPAAAQKNGGESGSVFMLHLGKRSVSNDYEPAEDPLVIGVEGVTRTRSPSSQSFGFEYGAFYASDSDDQGTRDVTSRFYELDLGPRFTFHEERFQIYIGGGPAFIMADAEVEDTGVDVSDDDTTFGIYYHAGMLFSVTEAMLFGLDARGVSGSDVTFEGFDTDADYFQVTAVIGFEI